jgi:arylsulfatase A-like enzyme
MNAIRAITIAALALAAASTINPAPEATAVEGPHPPNVVFIMLDDISTGYMDAMPVVRTQIGGKGVIMQNGITPTALCCPSRAATLTGDLAHSTGVYMNELPHGGYDAFTEVQDDALPVHLSQAGYRTALFGKFLNGYSNAPAGTVPPGWDEFQAFVNPNYYNYTLGGTVNVTYGDRPVLDYSTDVITQRTVSWINEQQAQPEDKPFFVYYSPYAAHAPLIAAPRHRGDWHDESLAGSFNEKNMSDKAPFMQQKPLFPNKQAFVTQQRKQHEMLMSTDEGVAQIIQAIGAEETANTLFIVMGDNGNSLGAHRLDGKNYPYVRATRVPMMLRLDGVIDSSLASRLTTNVDLTATIAEVAGAPWPMDGRSVLSTWRTGTVLEQVALVSTLYPSRSRPAYCGYRTPGWMYVKWSGKEGAEMYRYRSDPNELHSLIEVDQWNEKQQFLRQMTRQTCTPTPPGFTWS